MTKQLFFRRARRRQRPLPWARIWYQARLTLLMVAGACLAAFGYAMFQVPFNIVAGGVSGISMILSPLEFMKCLATLVPRPRLNLICFHGLPSAWLFSI